MADEHGIGTYPVGVLACILRRRGFRREWRYLVRQAKAGNWRAVRNAFNGYLAEWHYPPTDPAFARAGRCGRGWTRRRALKRLGRNIVAANLSAREVDRGE